MSNNIHNEIYGAGILYNSYQWNNQQYCNIHNDLKITVIVTITRVLRVVQTETISFFEINVGKSRIRHITTLNLNDVIVNRFCVDRDMSYLSKCRVKRNGFSKLGRKSGVTPLIIAGSDSFRH